MPVRKVTLKGKAGYQWGKSGKVYTGPKAKQKAAAQGRAVRAAGYPKKGKKR